MKQETRNKIYGVISGLVGILVIVGTVDKGTSEEALNLTNLLLDQGGQIIALVGLVTAFVKSLPSRVTTIDVPKKDVDSVVVRGQEVAPPA